MEVRRESEYRLVVLSYIVAAAMPPIGLFLGIVVSIRLTGASRRHGLWIILVSLIASLVWILLISSGALNTTSEGQ
jgi:hypothetical protein